MHPNPIFRRATDAHNLAFAKSRGFGVLCVNGAVGPLLAHLPFVISDDGKTIDMHVLRSNEISAVARQPVPSVISVSGPDGYVSPDWYGGDGYVPTWNYVSVHLRGHVRVLEATELRGILERLSAEFEGRIEGKPPWLMDKLDDEAGERMMRMLVPIRMQVDHVDGTWKLGQNKGDEALQAAADMMKTSVGHELTALEGLMRSPPA